MSYVAFFFFIALLMLWDLVFDWNDFRRPLEASTKLLEHRIKHTPLHPSDYPDTRLYRLLRRFSLPEK